MDNVHLPLLPIWLLGAPLLLGIIERIRAARS